MDNQYTTMYIVRHGQSESNVEAKIPHHLRKQTIHGKEGSPLSEYGKQQAQALRKVLENINFDAAFSSHKQRAQVTAEIILEGRRIPLQTVDTIYERVLGKVWDKLTDPERKEVEKSLYSLEEEEILAHRFSPDGESAKEALDRFISFVKDIAPIYAGKTILVVNHGMIMRSFLSFIGWARFEELPMGSVRNTAYFVLKTDGEQFKVIETYGIKKQEKE